MGGMTTLLLPHGYATALNNMKRYKEASPIRCHYNITHSKHGSADFYTHKWSKNSIRYFQEFIDYKCLPHKLEKGFDTPVWLKKSIKTINIMTANHKSIYCGSLCMSGKTSIEIKWGKNQANSKKLNLLYENIYIYIIAGRHKDDESFMEINTD